MSIKNDTIIRTALLFLALLNQCLSAMGKPVLPIEDETLEQLLTMLLTAASSLWAWWKNNSFTKAAIEADKTMNALKNKEVA